MTSGNLKMLSQIDYLLHHRFGLEQFRSPQREIILGVLAGKSQLAILPTGSGKSLCYQLPSLLLPHPTVVVSPLVALMKDQVDGLAKAKIRAHALVGSLSRDEQQKILQDWAEHQVPLIYLAPERLLHPEVIEGLKSQLKISLLVVDEAHCISEWGHDFRPDYRRIREFRELAGNPPILALTATASPRVRRDIGYQLGSPKFPLAYHESSIDRANISLGVQVTVSAREQKQRVLDTLLNNDRPTIIYAGTRRRTEEWATWLTSVMPRPVAMYHAGLPSSVRRLVQEQFGQGTLNVVVATTAFGMGINRRDVGLVLHVAIPESIAAYYQEVGRAGRDGSPAQARMIVRYHDIEQREFRLNGATPDYSAITRLVTAVENFPLHRLVRWELDEEDQLGTIVLAALHEMQMVTIEGRSGHVVSVTRQADFDPTVAESIGKRLQQQHQYRQEQFRLMKTYIFGQECRRVQVGQYFGQCLEPASVNCCDNCGSQPALVGHSANPNWSAVAQLRQWRREKSESAHVSPYIVLSDQAVHSLAYALPQTLEDLQLCPGIGPVKRERYGRELLAILQPFAFSAVMTSEPSQILQTPKTLAMQMFREGLPIGEVEKRVERSRSTVMEYLQEWIQTRDPDEWSSYVRRLLPTDTYRKIFAEFHRLGTERLRPVYEALSGTVPYDALRVARAVFQRELTFPPVS